MKKYITLQKEIGETPLSRADKWRSENPEYKEVSMAYAGRLDPMASGKLLILLGDECKKQTEYHHLDKEYNFSVLLGIESDSLDVLGRLKTCTPTDKILDEGSLMSISNGFVGDIELPYPRFSSKTVQGKPLHTWTLEGRLDEIEIPTKTSTVYSLSYTKTTTFDRSDLVYKALEKVNSIPPVTDIRKAIGNDFRRVDVRADWDNVLQNNTLPDSYTVLTFSCIASSGTYMRTLASLIAKKLDTCGLAWNIHRSKIGVFDSTTKTWTTEY